MGESRFVIESPQFRPRQTLGDEPHRNLIGMKTKRLGQCLMESLFRIGQPASPRPALGLLSQTKEPRRPKNLEQTFRGQLRQDL